jgi:hypothetical protein
MGKNDWPRYTEEEPEMYEQEELDTLFKACNEEDSERVHAKVNEIFA